MRRFGESIRADVTYTWRPGAYAIISEGPDLLLTLQESDQLEVQLPGGGIDPGETPTVALHREVYEETGYRIHSIRRLGAFQRYTFMPEYDLWAHKICHIYHCRPARRVSEPPDGDHTAIWMPRVSARHKLSSPGDRHFVSMFNGY